MSDYLYLGIIFVVFEACFARGMRRAFSVQGSAGARAGATGLRPVKSHLAPLHLAFCNVHLRIGCTTVLVFVLVIIFPFLFVRRCWSCQI